MRITDRTIVNHTISQLQDRRQLLADAQTRVATGRRLQRSSDDPADAERAMTLASELRMIQNQAASLDTTNDWLSGTDEGLRTFSDLLLAANSIAMRASNDTNSQTELDALANAVGSLLGNAMDTANSTQGGYYLFAGQQVRTKPFVYENGVITYKGDDLPMNHLIEMGQTMPVNVTGTDGPNGGLLNGLQQLQALQTALQSGDRTAIGDFIQEKENIDADLYMSQSVVGARMQRIDQISTRLSQRDIDLKQLYSNLVNADMAATIAEMNAESQAYEMSLAASGRVIPRSLLDYIR